MKFGVGNAVIKSVDECIRKNILREFLISQKAEVIKMSIYEFDEERISAMYNRSRKGKLTGRVD